MNKAILLLLVIVGLSSVEPHGYVRQPLARTSIFRNPSFGAQMPFWWNDTGVMCGDVVQDAQFSRCGRCGDAFGETHANQGGTYDKGIITGTYTAGQIIDVEVDITANHRGFMQFELCPQVTETNTCFTHRLNFVSGDRPIRSGNMMCTGNDHQNGVIRARVQLPAGVRCTRCTLRWTYRTSYPPNPDACFNGGPAQTFRNCVDIRIN
ncbi:hypothetical protein HA402_002223 [Bradysia odoriphaga]|nr:hypothetical protein HA402_002223 [Bradysia odoriphaga]